MAEKDNDFESLDWLQLKSDIGSVEIKRETGMEKLKRKCLENPLVPIGTTATIGCLLLGLQSFQRGESKRSQMMMRGRVLAQGFTVVSLVLGLIYTSSKRRSEQPSSTPIAPSKGPI